MAIDRIQRNTHQRQVILEELCRTTAHPTAADLYAVVRLRLPRISLGTVYRNLELLARLGTIQKLELAGSEARFDGNRTPHDHVRCVRCGRVDDLPGPARQLAEPVPGELHGYRVLDQRIEFSGLCPRCREQSST